MPFKLIEQEGTMYVRYNNRFFKERVEPLDVCLRESNDRIIIFQNIRPTLESYISKRVGAKVELSLDGSVYEGTCNEDSDIDIRVNLPPKRGGEDRARQIEEIINFLNDWDDKKQDGLVIDCPYRLHFLRNI